MELQNTTPVISAKNLDLWYGDFKPSSPSLWTWASGRSLP